MVTTSQPSKTSCYADQSTGSDNQLPQHVRADSAQRHKCKGQVATNAHSDRIIFMGYHMHMACKDGAAA